MEPVKALYNISKQLMVILQDSIIPDQREQSITEINRLLELRESFIKQIVPPYTDEQKELGKVIVKYNLIIDKELKKLKQTISSDIRQLKQQKQRKKIYENPYQSLSVDGMFLDKRN